MEGGIPDQAWRTPRRFSRYSVVPGLASPSRSDRPSAHPNHGCGTLGPPDGAERVLTQRYDHLESQLGAAIEAELGKIAHATRDLAGVAWEQLGPEPERLAKVAIVAADAGNVRLRLSPLRIAFVRVATSAREEPLGELVFPSELDASDLLDLVEAQLPDLVAPLRAAGLDLSRMLASTQARRDRLAGVREVLEWGAVLKTVGTPAPEPVLVVRDGLLRSIGMDEGSFSRLAEALRAASDRTGHQLVAVAKRVPGGADLANALMLGGVLDRRPPGEAVSWLRIPEHLEKDLLPGSFVVGRRMGPLLLVRVGATGSFVPVEVARKDDDSVRRAIGTLFAPDAVYWPEPGMPLEITVAHQRARISALDREWLHRAFLDQLTKRDPRLARRAVAAEVIGAGGALVTEDEG